MFENLKDKLASVMPETVFPDSLHDNVSPIECQIFFVSDGPLKGQSSILVNGKPFPVKQFDYSFGLKKGVVVLEQYITWMTDASSLQAAFAKLNIEVVFAPSTSLRESLPS